jgi:hypothetical protein
MMEFKYFVARSFERYAQAGVVEPFNQEYGRE